MSSLFQANMGCIIPNMVKEKQICLFGLSGGWPFAQKLNVILFFYIFEAAED